MPDAFEMTPPMLDLAVIGGGAAGFFTALRYAEMAPTGQVAIFEKGSHFLQKVRISGGGRCNVTHACDDPKHLATHYPRGSKELRAAFHRWQPSDTIEWFAGHGVTLKTEPDGRMFPDTDRSETIIQCFLDRAAACGIPLYQKHALIEIESLEGGGFSLQFENRAAPIHARAVCIATGSLKDSPLLKQLKKLDQTIEPLVPSLFAFNVSDPRISDLAGVSHPQVSIRREGGATAQLGPILITHRGFSGPGVLRLSAWEAREMAALNHHFPFVIDWLPEIPLESLKARFAEIRQTQGAKLLKNTPISPIPRRLWERLVACCEIADATTWGQLSKVASRTLLEALKSARFEAQGKTTNKDEFVTAGGIVRPSIDFRTMESRTVPGLYFAGECLDVDGITGGFNFQAAWTTGHIAACAIAAR
jgi:predicted Rossmann fold flavoprotein